MSEQRRADLERIEVALWAAAEAIAPFVPGEVAWERKAAGDPLTAADLAADEVLRETLARPGEGWLSEETPDSTDRLDRDRVWVVDPIDGTREFIDGVPEWCISVGLVESGRAVAGGILNPVTSELVLGSLETGVTLNGGATRVRDCPDLDGVALASRSELRRGEWARFERAPFEVVPCGSVAYKLSRVAAGLADFTFTLRPKNEWDVAAGVALIEAAGGASRLPDGSRRVFNQPSPLLPGLVVGGPAAVEVLCRDWLAG